MNNPLWGAKEWLLGEMSVLFLVHGNLIVASNLAIIWFFLTDSFLRMRDKSDHEATAMMKAQFMSLWDGNLELTMLFPIQSN